MSDNEWFLEWSDQEDEEVTTNDVDVVMDIDSEYNNYSYGGGLSVECEIEYLNKDKMRIPGVGKKSGNMLITRDGHVIGKDTEAFIPGCTVAYSFHYIYNSGLSGRAIYAVVPTKYSTKVLFCRDAEGKLVSVEDFEVKLEKSRYIDIVNIFPVGELYRPYVCMSTVDGIKYVFDYRGRRIVYFNSERLSTNLDAIGKCGDYDVLKDDTINGNIVSGFCSGPIFSPDIYWSGNVITLDDHRKIISHLDIQGLHCVIRNGMYMLSILSNNTVYVYSIFTFMKGSLPLGGLALVRVLDGEYKSPPIEIMGRLYLIDLNDILCNMSYDQPPSKFDGFSVNASGRLTKAAR